MSPEYFGAPAKNLEYHLQTQILAHYLGRRPLSLTQSTENQSTATLVVSKTAMLATHRPSVDPVGPPRSSQLNWPSKLEQSHAAYSSQTLKDLPHQRLDDQHVGGLEDFAAPISDFTAPTSENFKVHLPTEPLDHYSAVPNSPIYVTQRPAAEPVETLLSSQLNWPSKLGPYLRPTIFGPSPPPGFVRVHMRRPRCQLCASRHYRRRHLDKPAGALAHFRAELAHLLQTRLNPRASSFIPAASSRRNRWHYVVDPVTKNLRHSDYYNLYFFF